MLGSLRPLPMVPTRPPEPVVSRMRCLMRIALCTLVLWVDAFALCVFILGAADCSILALDLVFEAGAFSALATDTPASSEIAAAVAIRVFIVILQDWSNGSDGSWGAARRAGLPRKRDPPRSVPQPCCVLLLHCTYRQCIAKAR